MSEVAIVSNKSEAQKSAINNIKTLYKSWE